MRLSNQKYAADDLSSTASFESVVERQGSASTSDSSASKGCSGIYIVFGPCIKFGAASGVKYNMHKYAVCKKSFVREVEFYVTWSICNYKSFYAFQHLACCVHGQRKCSALSRLPRCALIAAPV